MDLDAVIAELHQISARLQVCVSPPEAADLKRRQAELRDRAKAFDAQVKRAEYERELAQLEARLEGMAERSISHRDPKRGFFRGALWGDYDFPKDAEKLNEMMGEALDRPLLEARVAELRSMLGLEAQD